MPKIISLTKTTVDRARREGQRPRLFGSIEDVVSSLRPSRPLYILEPERITDNARAFALEFPGTVMFAMKSNPDKAVIAALGKGGVKNFDCASIEEIRAARRLAPKAKIFFFMHPVKAREAIKEAYETHGVRAFSLDTVEELYKIIKETSYAPDLELFVRIATPSKGKAVISLSSKFGADPVLAVDLLQKCRPVAARLGVAFHVGFQCMDPRQYRLALRLAAGIIQQSGVKVDALDVGGGFPSSFANLAPPSREHYMAEIVRAVKDYRLHGLELLAEPGQSLVSNAGHVIARVELRKGDMLYLNDGVFGCLHDAGRDVGIKYPVRALRPEKEFVDEVIGFSLAGPTCTTEDMMPGPYFLPANIREGDWIEFSMTGAYAMTFRTDFNGFGKTDIVCLYGKKS